MVSLAWIIGPSLKGQRVLLPENPGAGIMETVNPDWSALQRFVDYVWLCITLC